MLSFSHLVPLGVIVVFSVLLACGSGEDKMASVTGDKDKTFSQRTLQSVHVLKKRAPGWGKRSLEDDMDNEDNELSLDSEDLLSGDLSKRAPGWGKRTLDVLDDYTKRAPGWGKRDLVGALAVKRAPGWGKRDIDMDKRAPGWGKRAPGWGKRAPGWGKRAPGWGKRAPGWGKRAPGWGKRSDTSCAGIDEEVDYYIYRAVQAEARRILECGSKYNGNDVLRK